MKKNLKKRNKKGFTLIELVVVIAILGILAAILVPVIGGFIETANQSADNANARLVYQSVAMYVASNADVTSATVITFDDIKLFLGTAAIPATKSNLYGPGDLEIGLDAAADGSLLIIVSAPDGQIYDTALGKLN